jgi:hypothetical protein
MLDAGLWDLRYLPRRKNGWDATLACLSYGARMTVDREPMGIDLNNWAVRHCLPASARYADLAGNAIVVWHGTTLKRAERIIQHGLFHKRGLWRSDPPWTDYSLPSASIGGSDMALQV